MRDKVSFLLVGWLIFNFGWPMAAADFLSCVGPRTARHAKVVPYIAEPSPGWNKIGGSMPVVVLLPLDRHEEEIKVCAKKHNGDWPKDRTEK